MSFIFINLNNELRQMGIVQINLQKDFGGGEIYTCFFGQALRALKQSFELVAHRDATWWREYDTGTTRIHLVESYDEIENIRFNQPNWLLFHTPAASTEKLNRLMEAGHKVACFSHLSLHQRKSDYFNNYALVIAVSEYVRNSLLARGIKHVYNEPMYGIAYLNRSKQRHSQSGVSKRSHFNWDKRKVRDRLFSWVYPLVSVFLPRRKYSPRSGLTLGIVSRITPAKQFPALFRIVAPILARHQNLNLEIFGSGGYASIRDTKRALKPLGDRVRWWGEQKDVAQVYPLFDFLLTGLPEKEAFGLNVIESQMCGTPVLAPNAPPFTETVIHGKSGYLYNDPRSDHGLDFEKLIDDLVAGLIPKPIPSTETGHLSKFNATSFRDRVSNFLDFLNTAQR